ncbi:hypothetical protein [Vibrio phage CKB-S1]|nr:hypothetical protein [Vibrio phage CKB-S1]
MTNEQHIVIRLEVVLKRYDHRVTIETIEAVKAELMRCWRDGLMYRPPVLTGNLPTEWTLYVAEG